MVENFDAQLKEIEKLVALKNYDRALKLVADLSEHFPNRYEALETRSEIYRRLGDFDLAYADLQRVIELVPNEVAPYFRRARWNVETERFSDAIEDLTKVIDAKNSYFLESAYFLRGLCFARTKQFEAAWQDCKHIQADFSLGPLFGSKEDLIQEIGRSIDVRHFP